MAATPRSSNNARATRQTASQRVLAEGGYEASSRPWKLSLEERIIGKVHELYGRRNP